MVIRLTPRAPRQLLFAQMKTAAREGRPSEKKPRSRGSLHELQRTQYCTPNFSDCQFRTHPRRPECAREKSGELYPEDRFTAARRRVLDALRRRSPHPSSLPPRPFDTEFVDRPAPVLTSTPVHLTPASPRAGNGPRCRCAAGRSTRQAHRTRATDGARGSARGLVEVRFRFVGPSWRRSPLCGCVGVACSMKSLARSHVNA